MLTDRCGCKESQETGRNSVPVTSSNCSARKKQSEKKVEKKESTKAGGHGAQSARTPGKTPPALPQRRRIGQPSRPPSPFVFAEETKCLPGVDLSEPVLAQIELLDRLESQQARAG